ncbi:MAG: bifunctional nuclease family protein [Thermoanaerobaculales bacterium]|jgi:bifunctional DNase/RNase|nr:bifunctional nuclease family protein [Thermoanaerobaculales bacterium]
MARPIEPDAVKVTIRALVVDPTTNSPVVILAKPEEDAYLPIWIGVCEANAIAVTLEGVVPPRPLTHDLIGSLITELGFHIDHVFIHNLDDSIFFASIRLRNGDGDHHAIDARPSDAIAVALRAQADVFVAPTVLAKAVVTETSQEEAVKTILERMRPEEMGDWEM